MTAGRDGGKRRPAMWAWRRGVAVLSSIAAAGLAATAILGWLGDLWWPFELFAHFRLIYLTGAGACALLALTASWRWSLLILVAALPHLYVVMEPGTATAAGMARADGSPHAANRLQRVRLLVFNVNFGNRRTSDLVGLIAREKPDVIVLQEFAGHWPAVLARLPATYRHRAQALGFRSDNAIVSRFPIRNIRVLAPDRLPFPPLSVDIDVNGTVVRMVGVHLPLPLTDRGYRNQTLYLATVARAVRTFHGPLIVAGDFNLTHWTRRLSRFAASGGLIRVAPSGLLARTRFPPGFGPLTPLLGLPIDHVFVRGPIRRISDRVARDIGSDHRPQIVDLELTVRPRPPRP